MRIRVAGAIVTAWALAATPSAAQTPDGEQLFQSFCAVCHTNPVDDKVPTSDEMRQLDPNAIVDSLTDGNMRLQGQLLTPAQHIVVAEYLTGRPVRAPSSQFTSGLCTGKAPWPALAAGGAWNGWGPDARNARFQPDAGGIVEGNVARLKLKWAFGIPDVTQSRAQPAVVGGRLFMGSTSGAVYALDAATGCTYWTFKAQAGVRTAISVGPTESGYAIYFADAAARAYSVDAATGRELWVTQVDGHAGARSTGAPTLDNGRLYVPVSGIAEENAASMPGYECCTFRGSLTSLDAATGEVVWKTYLVDEPTRRGESSTGTRLWGPAGVSIWSAPTIDAKRGLVYAATGNAYADPNPPTSDAIVAFSIETGEIKWINQITPGDVWILGCSAPPPGVLAAVGAARDSPETGDNPNCPEDVGPDFDFSASPALVTMRDGTDRLVITQKSGVGYALDPDAEGQKIWEYRWGQGSPVGGVWGASTDGQRAFFAVADQFTPAPGGLHGVDLATGERLWHVPPPAPICAAGPGCGPAQSAAVTSIPGVVFSGSVDGGMRAYAAGTGEVLWVFDTNQRFATVNGVEARGGSMDGPGPVVAGGMLFVTAGNGGFVGTPGNVLLAFGVE